jgi:CheY-like chemotaxis protein
VNILLVDDEAMIRKMMKTMLQKRGHDVFDAADGVHALALSDQHRIDVLITDIVMQELGGFSLAKALAIRQPNLPVLFISGYPIDSEAQRAEHQNGAFLKKPFGAQDLVTALSNLLGPERPV